jgi:hypothetical protein
VYGLVESQLIFGLDMTTFKQSDNDVTLSRYYSFLLAFRKFDVQWTSSAMFGKFMYTLLNAWGEVEEDTTEERQAEKLLIEALENCFNDTNEDVDIPPLVDHDALVDDDAHVDATADTKKHNKSLAEWRDEFKNRLQTCVAMLQSKKLHIDSRRIADVMEVMHQGYEDSLKAHKTPQSSSEWRARRACEEWIEMLYDLAFIPACEPTIKRYLGKKYVQSRAIVQTIVVPHYMLVEVHAFEFGSQAFSCSRLILACPARRNDPSCYATFIVQLLLPWYDITTSEDCVWLKCLDSRIRPDLFVGEVVIMEEETKLVVASIAQRAWSHDGTEVVQARMHRVNITLA